MTLSASFFNLFIVEEDIEYMEQVILVDKNDKEVGVEEKINAHKEGKLHRCFSIVIFNSKGRLLLQKRAKSKYHSGGLWSNTCCGHPRPGEDIKRAAHRRLEEEMGFDCPLKEIFTFTYYHKFDNGLIENEFDHVFAGRFDGHPKPNSSEAEGWKWASLEEIEKDIQDYPEKYTFWFKIIVDKLKQR